MTLRHRRILILVAAAVMAAMVAVYAIFDPAESRWFPQCSIKLITGWDCPGCGSQRAVHALLHGRFAEAWHYNPLFILEIPLLAILIFTGIRPERFPRLTHFLTSRPFIIGLLITILTFTILRNLI